MFTFLRSLSYPVTVNSIIIGAIVLLSSNVALGDNSIKGTRLITGLSLGSSTLSFPEKLDHDISFPSANLILAVTNKRWQLSLNSAFSLSDAKISEEEDTGDASRRDTDLTLGYQASKHWGVYLGFKNGETAITFTPRDLEDDDLLTSTSEKYSQRGPYIGGSFNWRFEKAGRLTVSIAYAKLDAVNDFEENTDEEEDEDEALEFDDLTGRVKGDITGFSYSLSWTMPLSGNLLFQTKFKVNDYKQDINVDGITFNNIDEKFILLHVGLAYVF
ncbi:MAG: hypothetical protein COA99_03845 [Moraxellaceae bacterium]|nr:MAG: hypothetical protein COA99_03845 [Moraxellaceae bacterium]